MFVLSVCDKPSSTNYKSNQFISGQQVVVMCALCWSLVDGQLLRQSLFPFVH